MTLGAEGKSLGETQSKTNACALCSYSSDLFGVRCKGPLNVSFANRSGRRLRRAKISGRGTEDVNAERAKSLTGGHKCKESTSQTTTG